jgi:ribonuclease P protein component
MVSRKLIDTLFGGEGSRSVAAFPLRVVFAQRDATDYDAKVQMLVSVPKKRFKHAVDRNRVKRQVREAFRQHKELLYDAVAPGKQLLMAFIWIADGHRPSAEVEKRVVTVMQRVAEKL